jgi:hypothetical protein
LYVKFQYGVWLISFIPLLNKKYFYELFVVDLLLEIRKIMDYFMCCNRAYIIHLLLASISKLNGSKMICGGL